MYIKVTKPAGIMSLVRTEQERVRSSATLLWSHEVGEVRVDGWVNRTSELALTRTTQVPLWCAPKVTFAGNLGEHLGRPLENA